MNTQPASTAALADALQGLRDYHLPEAVSWWPLAPGWWLLLTLAVLVLAVFWWWLLRQHRRRAAARQAIRELAVLRTALKQQRDDAAFLRGVSKLLRRYVLAVCPGQAATLTGEEWLAFLDARGGAGRFSNGPGRHLVDAPYRRTTEIAVDDIAELVHDWIRCNREATPVISLAAPWVLLFLPLPLLVRRLVPAAPPRAVAALRLPFLREVRGPRSGAGGGAKRSGHILAWLAWVLLVVAAAQPQWLGDPLRLPVAGRDLMLAVDVSGSMEQDDYRLNGRPVNRLSVVKAVAGRFIARREGDRLGLVLFGTRAYLQTPLTYDRATVQTMLDEAVIGLAGRDTAIGDAIAVAVKRLKEQAQDDRVLILLTDGANTVGNIAPLDAARVAARAGVRIYTIGIGGSPVGVPTPFGMLTQVGSDLDPATLSAIASETGGRYFEATDTEQLAQIYAELDRLEPSVRDTRSFRPMHSLFVWPAGTALIISGALAIFGLPRRAPIEQAGGDA